MGHNSNYHAFGHYARRSENPSAAQRRRDQRTAKRTEMYAKLPAKAQAYVSPAEMHALVVAGRQAGRDYGWTRHSVTVYAGFSEATLDRLVSRDLATRRDPRPDTGETGYTYQLTPLGRRWSDRLRQLLGYAAYPSFEEKP